ncbi:MAG: AAA family ATPase [Candidatus Marinimicrobia bacterium]|nr:AAA family ATPase [Candidatus Neomarinimicrobiota bacterium]
MSGKIISIISNKGGVGKTLFAIEVANFLGLMGKEVLLIDTDINTGDVSIKLDLRTGKTLLDFFEKNESYLDNLIIVGNYALSNNFYD